jgi:hypothetical protein
LNFRIFQRYIYGAETHDGTHAWSIQRVQAIAIGEMTEDVAWKQGELHGLCAIGPRMAHALQGQKVFEAAQAEVLGSDLLMTRFYG